MLFCTVSPIDRGAESRGSLEVLIAAGLPESQSEKDSRVAECDIVKVIPGAVRLFLCLISKDLF